MSYFYPHFEESRVCVPQSLVAIVIAMIVFVNSSTVVAGTVADAKALPLPSNATIDNLILTRVIDFTESGGNQVIYGQDATGGTGLIASTQNMAALLTGPDGIPGTADDVVNGSRIDVTGTTVTFNGLFQIGEIPFPMNWNYDGNFGVPNPIVTTFAEVQDDSAVAESRQGMLISLEGATFSDSGFFTGVRNYIVSNGALDATVRVSTSAMPLVGTRIPTGEVNLIGILSQFDQTIPFDDNYQLLISSFDDIVYTPEITSVAGNLTQTPTSVLEIKVGGLDPNTPEHDRYEVTGTATLDGRLEVPLVNIGSGVFTPTDNDEVTIIDAGSVTGQFDTLFSPNLATVAPGLALRVITTPTEARVQFTQQDPNNVFQGTAVSSNWAEISNWSDASTPDSTNVIAVNNTSAADQRLEISDDPNTPDSQNAFVQSLMVEGVTNTMTVVVSSGSNLSAVTGLDVVGNGIVELDGGTIVTTVLEVSDGGQFVGEGTVVGDVVIGDGSTGMSTISLGLDTTASLTIQGNYSQESDGTLLVDVDDPNSFDSLAIAGNATLDGMVELMLDDPNAFVLGTPVEIISASTIDGEFDDVFVQGNDDLTIAQIYDSDSFSVLIAEEGDMDPFTPGIGEEDAVAFALALTDPVAYRNTYGISADEAGDIDDIGDNGLDFDDIDDFIKLYNEATGGSLSMARMFRIIEQVQSVPEPSSAILGAFACCYSLLRRNRAKDIDGGKGVHP